MDWLLDARGNVYLLEVNAFPDFAQSGDAGWSVVKELWEGVMALVLREMGVAFSKAEGDGEGDYGVGMEKVLDVDLGRRR